MKLLFDANLSRRLLKRLEGVFPLSRHVNLETLPSRTDRAIWDYAAFHGLAIVSKDNDFRQLSFLHGAPPKVVWMSVGNAGTDVIGDLLARSRDRIAAFLEDPEEGLLVIELPSPTQASMPGLPESAG